MGWQKDASCAGLPIEEFYADKVTNLTRRVCHNCPVQPDCLSFAMKEEGLSARFGMWGGLSATERHVLAAGS